jgi:Ca2+-binding RTX toxin-like protein
MTTYTGTTGNDTALGAAGAGADTLIGLTGNDTYIVNNIGDVIQEDFNFGTDIDTIQTSVLDSLKTYSLERWVNVENLTYTGTLASVLKGNALNNVIKANASSSVVVNDTLYGGAGSDTLFGYFGNDSLMGDSGNDSIDGGAGVDMMVGGTGNDTFVIDSTSDRAFEYSNGGFDTIRSPVIKDLRLSWTTQVEGLTYTGTTVATLYGNKLSNAVTSTSATNDTLYGYEGNDTLDGGNGTDSMVGGVGDDQYLVSTTDVVLEVAGQGIDAFVGAKTDIGLGSYATTIENLFYTGTTGAAVKGNAMDNVVSGGSGNDTITGLDGNDSLIGGAGGDSLTGGNGNDDLYGGGVFNYTFDGDYVIPDTVRDTLNGGAGNDFYAIDSDLDIITEATDGGTLDRVYSRIDNSLTRYANVEALVLEEGTAAWFGQGGTGNDIIVGNTASNYLDGGAGNDTLAGHVDSYSFNGLASDVVEGGAGNDVLIDFNFGSFYNNSEETTLFGGAGNDLYVLGDSLGFAGGLDTGGTDTALLLGSGSIEALEGVEYLVLYGTGGADDVRALAAINSVHLAAKDDAFFGSLGTALNGTGNELVNRITGNGFDNLLAGLGGNDTIDGGAGDDTIDGGVGNDSMIGGSGNDTFIVNTGDVVVEAVSGGTLDIISSSTLTTYAAFANLEGLIYTGTANVSLNNGSTNTSNDFFEGGSGNDTLLGYGGNDSLSGNGGNDSVNGGAGLDNLSGGDGNDSMLGDAGVDELDGGAGNDTIDGGTDGDEIYGGLGVDSLLGGEGSDVLISSQYRYNYDDMSTNTLRGGAGNDDLEGGAAADLLYGDAGSDDLRGGAGNDTMDGGTENDTLYGANGADSILGGDGDDYLADYNTDGLGNTFRGGNGADDIDGDDGADKLYGDAGNDDLSGGAGNDSLEGGIENDDLSGGEGVDTLLGQAGNDSLYGDAGNDLVNGGGGEVNSGLYYVVGGDVLWGDQQFGSSSAGVDKFRLNAPTVANQAIDAFAGLRYFNTGTLIADFNPASDLIEFTAAMVGDGNTTLTTAVKDTVGGTFSGTSEMTIFRTNVAELFGSQYNMNAFDAADVTAVIGNASAAFTLGAERLFVVDDGTASAIFQFVSSDADALVEINELFLVAVVANNSALVAGDFVLA